MALAAADFNKGRKIIVSDSQKEKLVLYIMEANALSTFGIEISILAKLDTTDKEISDFFFKNIKTVRDKSTSICKKLLTLLGQKKPDPDKAAGLEAELEEMKLLSKLITKVFKDNFNDKKIAERNEQKFKLEQMLENSGELDDYDDYPSILFDEDEEEEVEEDE